LSLLFTGLGGVVAAGRARKERRMEDRPQWPAQDPLPQDPGNEPFYRRWWAALTDRWQKWRARRSRPPLRGETAPFTRPPRPDAAPDREKRSWVPSWLRWPFRREKAPALEDEQVTRWVALLAHSEDPAHTRALDELVVIGRPAVPALVASLDSETWIQVFRASEALGLIGDRRAARSLMRLLDHPNSNVRWGAAEALGRIRSRWARGRLHRAAQDDESRTSWGEMVAEAAERAVASIDRTMFSRVLTFLQIVVLVAACIGIGYTAYRIISSELADRVVPTAVPTPTETVVFTPTATATPTRTPVPTMEPIAGTITTDSANVQDLPSVESGQVIATLHFGDEVWIYRGRVDEVDDLWYLVRLKEIHNPATVSELLEGGAYGWVYSGRVAGVEAPDVAPTVAAVETMLAAEATPTPLGSSLEMTPIVPTPTSTSTPTPTP
jgi:hypothetical protein